ncbi:hypothetical protein [Streptomyces olivochromogenes]|uniref:hypothetical protein n=1 Tax=Streptomyces olivochromogenes TaxID=1963 RepID=UPI003689ABB4
MDGDPIEDFDTLVRTASASVSERWRGTTEDDRLEAGRLMRRDGCCRTGSL